MPQPFATSIAKLAQEGFVRLPGLSLSGEVPLRQDVLNAWLSAASPALEHARLHIESDNRLRIHVGVLQATATLQPAAALGASPTIALVLESRVVAWTLSAFLRAPFIALDGRVVTIDLSRVPALASWRAALGHLERLSFTSAPGVLTVQLGWQVT
jgi:hypothetical protein